MTVTSAPLSIRKASGTSDPRIDSGAFLVPLMVVEAVVRVVPSAGIDSAAIRRGVGVSISVEGPDGLHFGPWSLADAAAE